MQAHFLIQEKQIIIEKISVKTCSAFMVYGYACLSYHAMTLCCLIYVFTDALTDSFVAMYS